MFGKYDWLFYVAMAGLSWGTYVPLIFYGGNELGGRPTSRVLGILCVGVAYFVIGVLFPIIYLYVMTPADQRPEPTSNGLIFSGLAGVAGALGAICVIFATKSAIGAANDAGLNPNSYKLYIAPLIFGAAPVINTIVSLVWHPKKGNPLGFGLEIEFNASTLMLLGGIVLVGAGAALVLFSKELSESSKGPAIKPSASSSSSTESSASSSSSGSPSSSSGSQP